MQLNGDLLVDDNITAISILANDAFFNSLGNTPLDATKLTGIINDARLSINVLKHTGGYPGGTVNYLRADGSFATPPGAGGGVAGSNLQVQFNDNGVMGANAAFTFNKANAELNVGGNIISKGFLYPGSINTGVVQTSYLLAGHLENSGLYTNGNFWVAGGLTVIGGSSFAAISSGAINGQTITGAANFTGTLSVASTLSISGRTIVYGGSGTGYHNAPIEIQMTSAPRISFHWAGVIASQIGVDSAGVIRTYDNPGTGYEKFACAGLIANSNIFTRGYLMSTGVVYPGRVDVASEQSAWYLGSHASYGLYSNTGLFLVGGLSTGGPVYITHAVAQGLVINTSYATGSYMVFQNNGVAKGWIGSAYAMGWGTNVNDLAIYAIGGGGRIRFESEGGQLSSVTMYNNTVTSGANVLISSDEGKLFRVTSSRRYKTNIEPLRDFKWFLDLEAVEFADINHPDERKYIGFTAEDVAEKGPMRNGVPMMAGLNMKGEPDDVLYANMVAVIQLVLKDHEQRLKGIEDGNERRISTNAIGEGSRFLDAPSVSTSPASEGSEGGAS